VRSFPANLLSNEVGAMDAPLDLVAVDLDGRLFISPVIHRWKEIAQQGIDIVIDLEGELDVGVPTIPDQILYIYFPIHDDDLPSIAKLHGLGRLGAQLVQSGHRVLAHCGMGYNRSALMAGMILNHLGYPGPEIVSQLQARRPGALFNERFAEYLRSLPAP
jgi:protein-tyrosine phosphatase